jgi:hypothetical protein
VGLQPLRQISHMSTLLSGVVFGEIKLAEQFLIDCAVKALIWINTNA